MVPKKFDASLILNRKTCKLADSTLDFLANFPIETLLQRSYVHGQSLDGIQIFTDDRQTWEDHLGGGELSWRGAVNAEQLQTLWRAACCLVLDPQRCRLCTGFRLVDKTLDGSPMLKVEFWTDGDDKQTRSAILEACKLPASNTQFAFVAHASKVQHNRRSVHGAPSLRSKN